MWNWYNKRPSILADEMGLGKTIQTIGFLEELRLSPSPLVNTRGPFLVVAPLSLVQQWQSECEEWTGSDLNCIVYHGNAEARQIIRDYEFFYHNDGGSFGSISTASGTRFPKFQLLITTYEMAIRDVKILGKFRWRCLVVDEAHR
jgi:chromodomain-helicase-DNA-binding protein 7